MIASLQCPSLSAADACEPTCQGNHWHVQIGVGHKALILGVRLYQRWTGRQPDLGGRYSMSESPIQLELAFLVMVLYGF